MIGRGVNELSATIHEHQVRFAAHTEIVVDHNLCSQPVLCRSFRTSMRMSMVAEVIMRQFPQIVLVERTMKISGWLAHAVTYSVQLTS